MAINITIKDQSGSELSYELEQNIITFGRSKSCHVELGHHNVSRKHFIIRYINQNYELMDVNSRKGTILDGHYLVPLTSYKLKQQHLVQVPGFLINIYSDEKPPKITKTSVATRNLLDELMNDFSSIRPYATLRSLDEQYCFNFVEEKAIFVMGSSIETDFYVNDPKIAPKHLSFIRDINGIQLIPLPGHLLLLNDQSIVEPINISSGARLKVGETEFIFYDNIKEAIKTIVDKKSSKPYSIFHILDKIFFWSFIVILTAASFFIYELI